MARRFRRSSGWYSLSGPQGMFLMSADQRASAAEETQGKGRHAELSCGCHSASSVATPVLAQCSVNKVGVRAGGCAYVQQQNFPLQWLTWSLAPLNARFAEQCPVLNISYDTTCQTRDRWIDHLLDPFWPSSTKWNAELLGSIPPIGNSSGTQWMRGPGSLEGVICYSREPFTKH